MARGTNRYRGASAQPRNRKPAPPRGRLGRFADRVTSIPRAIASRLARRKARRETVVLASMALSIVLALGCLGFGYAYIRNDHDWTAVASVNGHDISREALRGRIQVLSFLAAQRAGFINEQSLATTVTAEQANALSTAANAPLSDLVNAARESLIDDELLRQLAARDGVATPAGADPWAEGARFAAGDFAQRVRYVRFGLPLTSASDPSSGSPAPSGSSEQASGGPWPQASVANLAAATARLRAELTANTSVSVIIGALHDAGWQAIGEDVALSSQGNPADTSLDLDASIAAGAPRGKADDLLGPTTDLYGRTSMARILGAPDSSHMQQVMPWDADKAKIDTAAMASWANGQALQRAVAASLIARWGSSQIEQAHLRELVIGSVPGSDATAGPWVELSALSLDRLSSVDPNSVASAPPGLDLHADALAATLRGLDASKRTALWRSLVAAAKSNGSRDQSGEIGFVGKFNLVPAVGDAVFADKVRSGDIVGPISTPSGSELFLVESRYAGSLDDASKAAIEQVRADPAADPATWTKKLSPADVALASDAGWRAQAEFSAAEPSNAALFETATGILSDPFVVDGKLVLALVDQRELAVPDARMLDRLSLNGYDAWFTTERSKATVTLNSNPLPELATPAPSASATPLATGTAATPAVPTMPGPPAATPIRTDAFGLPALP